ncbi:MAG: SoxR reducing system RseC family protein [Sphaerochaetaceae bacterium]
MYEQASVVSIQTNGLITVSCQSAGCESCAAGALCNTKGKTFVAHNHAEELLNVGDTVELYLPPGKTVFAGFITLLVPILLFPVGYYLPSLFMKQATEMVRLVFGIGGIALGFLISRLFSKANAHEYTPSITRIIERK